LDALKGKEIVCGSYFGNRPISGTLPNINLPRHKKSQFHGVIELSGKDTPKERIARGIETPVADRSAYPVYVGRDFSDFAYYARN
jgi:hypothetical protein